MRFIIPWIGSRQAADLRLAEVAAFVGIEATWLPLTTGDQNPAASLAADLGSGECCLVVNPDVLREWLGSGEIPRELTDGFRFPQVKFVMIHALRPDLYHGHVAREFSGGAFEAVEAAQGGYEMAPGSEEICEAFSGLAFGTANVENDSVLTAGETSAAVRTWISIGGKPFFAGCKWSGREILFLAGRSPANVQEEVGEAPVASYFSQFVPYVMALRHMFGEACWRPGERRAAVIIDDPLLRMRYGFLNLETLRGLLVRHEFHAVIAFIPHNWRRSSARIARMFCENAERLSICFHGNDHTGAEFSSANTTLLNTMAQIATKRIEAHHRRTGVPCDRVMVFPQGNFSVEAMRVLKGQNFLAAVNTVPYPRVAPARLTLAELAQPAVLRYGAFPLFLRRTIENTQTSDVAFCLMFGRPILIVVHHETFERPKALTDLARRINAMAPDIAWSNLASVVRGSYLQRKASTGVEIRAYAAGVRVVNPTGRAAEVSITWAAPEDGVPVEYVMDGQDRRDGFEAGAEGIRYSTAMLPHSEHVFTKVHRNPYPLSRGLGFKRWAKAIVRRRLSEVRDNYLSRNPRVLEVAQAIGKKISL